MELLNDDYAAEAGDAGGSSRMRVGGDALARRGPEAAKVKAEQMALQAKNEKIRLARLHRGTGVGGKQPPVHACRHARTHP